MNAINKKSDKVIYWIFLFLLIFILALNFYEYGKKTNVELKPTIEIDDTKNFKIINYSEINIDQDGTKYIIHPNEIISGGVPKGEIGKDGGIPALDENNIKWTNTAKANEWIKDDELIIKFTYRNETRIYPFQILVFHEIVNDKIQNLPILVTYCPLCGTSIIYEREINYNGNPTDTKFGVSGKLYNSNLIMYDKLTDTYWQQIEGNAIIGELTGQKLMPIESNTITWKNFKNSNEYKDPKTKVLSKETGINRPYGSDPYGSYYTDYSLYFPPENKNGRYHPKEIVLGIEINGKYKGYIEKDILSNKENIIYDDFENTNIKILKSKNNEITFINQDTGKIIVKERNMFFSWYAFHPKTQIWSSNKR